jgi:two-component system response regulator MprA
VLPRLLIVDDDPEILDGLLDLLGDNYEVDGALDGATAIEKLQAGRYDAVLLDLMMPVLDGAGVKRRMDALGIKTPVVLLSAGRDLQKAAQDLGVTHYLAKPFQPEALEAKLARILG